MLEVSEVLEQLGLSKKEVEVYLALLALGESGIAHISERSGVSRATTYKLLEGLAYRRLIEEVDDGVKKQYKAHSPKVLERLIREEQERVFEKRLGLEKQLPFLMALFQKQGKRPHIRYVEGVDRISEIRKMFLETKGEAMQIVPLGEVERFESLVQDREKHRERFSKQGVKGRALAIGEAYHLDQLSVLPGEEIRLLPYSRFPIHAEITIRGNTIFLCAYGDDPMAAIITHKDLAISAKTLFELAWAGAQKYPTKKGF